MRPPEPHPRRAFRSTERDARRPFPVPFAQLSLNLCFTFGDTFGAVAGEACVPFGPAKGTRGWTKRDGRFHFGGFDRDGRYLSVGFGGILPPRAPRPPETVAPGAWWATSPLLDVAVGRWRSPLDDY